MRIGVDTGGTFTDCVVFDGARVEIVKVFSTPETAARGILEGVQRLARGRAPGIDVVHGTTVGTNSLLERRGARVALVTTAGFEDLIEIGRQARPRLYDLNVRRDPPLVSPALRLGVRERTAADGKSLLRPAPGELRGLRLRLERSRAESVALCFLFSFANPANERRVARALRGLGLPLSVSHEILPEFREYERLSTVVINAYLAPRMGAYLSSLEQSVGEGLDGPPAGGTTAPKKNGRGVTCPDDVGKPLPDRGGRVYVMQSSGGITTARRAAVEPVRTILSGPAGGVVAAAWLTELIHAPRAISFDMGGTSTDVCLIDGRPRVTHETTLGGLPVAVPVLDVHSVGAGGGSLARVDAGGALRVGPESAGAAPGPICYARGGTQPTVTDAHLLLGRLDPDYFLGGEFRLDARAAESGLVEFLRRNPRSAGLPNPQALARGILAVSNATMEKALRVISVERGYDPRDFALVCFGGAGGLHAADLARSMRLPQVVVPQNPGAFSALGILLSDVLKDVAHSLLCPVPETGDPPARMKAFWRQLDSRFAYLERQARGELAREGFARQRAEAERRIDLRYAGQSYELSVPFTRTFVDQFHREHEKAYGYAHAGRPLEVVSLRLRLTLRTPKPALRPERLRLRQKGEAAVVKRKTVWFAGRIWKTPLYARERLEPGMQFSGPAVIVEYSSTTVVPPDFVCWVDEFRNLVLRPRASRGRSLAF